MFTLRKTFIAHVVAHQGSYRKCILIRCNQLMNKVLSVFLCVVIENLLAEERSQKILKQRLNEK